MAIASKDRAALAGVIGAGVALAVGQLTSAVLDATPSPVLAVGGRFVDEFAANLKEIAVELFGTNDKPALVTGTVAISLVLGVLIGIGARRHRWLPTVGLGVFGLVGALAQQADARDVGSVAWLIALLSVGAGSLTIATLLRIADQAAAEPTAIGEQAAEALAVGAASGDRRRFLAVAGALGIGALATTIIARSIGARDVVAEAAKNLKFPAPIRRRPAPADQPFAIDGISSYVTPNAEFYRIDTALSTPQIDAKTWRLRVGGMVHNPFEMTFDELLKLPSIEETVTLQCVSNEVGGDLVGNATWQGVPLQDLLERAGVKAGADQIFSRSVDGWTCGFPTEAATDGRVALVAYAMNGEPLPAPHGFPARLVISGLYGYVSATKWLEEIELTTWDDVDGYWISRGWSKEGPIKLASRIDVPRSGASVPAGEVTFGGVAWRPDVGVAAVEVSIDEGPWKDAELGRVASEHTWVQWRLRTPLAAGAHRARVRAVDADGRVQTAERAEPAPDGATGLDEVDFTVEGS